MVKQLPCAGWLKSTAAGRFGPKIDRDRQTAASSMKSFAGVDQLAAKIGKSGQTSDKLTGRSQRKASCWTLAPPLSAVPCRKTRPPAGVMDTGIDRGANLAEKRCNRHGALLGVLTLRPWPQAAVGALVSRGARHQRCDGGRDKQSSSAADEDRAQVRPLCAANALKTRGSQNAETSATPNGAGVRAESGAAEPRKPAQDDLRDACREPEPPAALHAPWARLLSATRRELDLRKVGRDSPPTLAGFLRVRRRPTPEHTTQTLRPTRRPWMELGRLRCAANVSVLVGGRGCISHGWDLQRLEQRRMGRAPVGLCVCYKATYEVSGTGFGRQRSALGV